MAPMVDQVLVETSTFQDVVLEKEMREIEKDFQAMGAIYEIQETLEENTGALTPVALRVAAESLHHRCKRFDPAPVTGFARESFMESLKQSGIEARDALIAKAKQALTAAAVSLGKRFSNVYERFKLLVRTAFRFDSTWQKEARAITTRAKSMRGITPRNDVFFDNRIKVAHLTDGEFEVHTEASKLVQDFSHTYTAFNEVAIMLRNLKKIFDTKDRDSGKFDFRPLAKSLPESKFAEHRRTLSGNLAIFGEEYTVNDVSGISEDVGGLIRHIKSFRFHVEHVWKVSDLRQPRLPAMSADDIIREGDALAHLAEITYEHCLRWNEEIGAYQRDAREKMTKGFWTNVDFWRNPKNFMLFSGSYSVCVTNFCNVLGRAVHNHAATLMCLADYYKWSLDQHEKD